MLKALKSAVIGLFSSKKFVAGLFSAVAAGCMRLGWDVEAETVALVLSPSISAIIGQGIADVSKGKLPA